jgi:uncharacterized membrane protein
MLHLFHPALVHFTVTLIVLGGGIEVAGLLTAREALGRQGGRLLLAGLASLVPTIASGYLAANTVTLPPGSEAVLEAHERNGLIVLGLLLGSQFWKAWCGGRVPPGADKLYAALVALVVGMTVYGAWLGGTMVYVYGIGVR